MLSLWYGYGDHFDDHILMIIITLMIHDSLSLRFMLHFDDDDHFADHFDVHFDDHIRCYHFDTVMVTTCYAHRGKGFK